MTQWYCYVGGRQYGPVSEEQLRAWIAEGRTRPSDHVWTAGMTDWAAAGAIPGLFAPGAAAPPDSMVPAGPPGGTRGQTGIGDLMSQGWAAMRGRWGIAIGFFVLYALLQFAIGTAQKFVRFGGLSNLVIQGPFTLGYTIFFMTLVRGVEPQLGAMFAGFRNFGNALAAYLLMLVFITLWTLAAALPGVVLGVILAAAVEPMAGAIVGGVVAGVPAVIAATIATLRYSQTYYLLADKRSLGPLQAIRRSKGLMKGFKGKLFCLGLIMGLLALAVCLPTCGIGIIFAAPYMGPVQARFYDDLRPAREHAAAPVLPASPGPAPEASGPAPAAPAAPADQQT